MKVKTEVAELLTTMAHNIDVESAHNADIGNYGASDRLDRLKDGLLAAREAYLNTFKSDSAPAPGLVEFAAALNDYRTPFRRFLEDAPVGSRLVGIVPGYTNYTKVIGGWRGDGRNTTWPTASFGDEEKQYFELVPA